MTNVFFRPWVGENYKAKGFNGKRILVLGESCYCGGCPECGGNTLLPEGIEGEDWWQECREKIPDVVKTFLASTKGKTYRRFTNVFMGHECTPEETQTLWNSFVFYNYVQTAPEGPSIPLKPWEWETGKKPFFEVLAEYDPDVIIAWGRRLWNNMPSAALVDESFLNRWGDGLRYYNNGERNIPAYACYHPCRPLFSEEDTDYFKRLLEKVARG